VEALTQLAEQVPWRQDVWLRLGLAALRADADIAHDALERAAAGRDDLAVARRALLTLADRDILAGDHARARRWLDRIPSHPAQPDPELALRRIECALARGETKRIVAEAAALDGLDPEASTFSGLTTLGGRRRLVRAHLARLDPEGRHGGTALSLALGALLLDAPGAAELVAELLADTRDAAAVARAREVLATTGKLETPRFRAAFALAEGRRADARDALMKAADEGDAQAATTLLTLAATWQRVDVLAAVATSHGDLLSEDQHLLLEAHRHVDAGENVAAVQALERIVDPAMLAWADALLESAIGAWRGEGEAPSDWDPLLAELRRAATELDRLDQIAPIEALAVERERPLLVAVLGEFNAGKSTLLNALLGTDVAPTGVMPTTASLHHVAWAPDPFARVMVRGGSDRVVPHAELKTMLTALRRAGETVHQVLIYAPIERLKRIEILDTPGFNAPETTHAEEARRGIERAHVALWLLDATAPLKDSERRVIEQVAAARVPIQVLVNKRDRVGDEGIGDVMTYVASALEQVGIRSLAPPVAFSAQQALAGRLGDDAALQASRWSDVEKILADDIVNRSDLLREGALRRKAVHIAASLEQAAATRALEHDEAARDWEEREARRHQLASTFRNERGALAESIMQRLDAPLDQLWVDARPLEQLTEERQKSQEVRNYLVDRCVARLAPVIVSALVEEAGDDLSRAGVSAVERSVRATIAGAAAAHRSAPFPEGDALRAAVSAAVAAAADEVDAAGTSPPGHATRHRGVRRRLAAFASVFGERGSVVDDPSEDGGGDGDQHDDE
ncbi:MAG TPA: GTP-binding protein, partial [Polyangiaceae bacterium]|nr:GTP-binding protein [Polyangiaceae bacterium]